ncbi:hypothetical protein N480_09550 [Pseudoalteromonas luteoviolacea S2607]|nr:hypothetical protein N480_09550 [Pseudoalteromonas luteoviolacea S2607]
MMANTYFTGVVMPKLGMMAAATLLAPPNGLMHKLSKRSDQNRNQRPKVDESYN